MSIARRYDRVGPCLDCPAWFCPAFRNRTTYEYDGHDRLVKTFFPSPTTDNTSSTTDYEQVGYDANGNVTSFRTRRNETLTMTYDNLGRMTLKDVPTRSGLATTHTRDVYFGYDLFGGMAYARFDSASGEGITNAFNALGQLTSTTTNMDGVSRALSYLYDTTGNRTQELSLAADGTAGAIAACRLWRRDELAEAVAQTAAVGDKVSGGPGS